MSDQHVSITDHSSGKSLDLPVIKGTEGEPTLHIKALPSTLGYFTYDPGFTATASCTSKITFIDGGKGILRYRGYPIEQLAGKSNFLEVAFLLLSGELPSEAEFEEFEALVEKDRQLREAAMAEEDPELREKLWEEYRKYKTGSAPADGAP